MTTVKYDQDIVAWANEQAALLRAGRYELLDIEHIADEIEDVGKSEQRELISRMAVLLAHLLKWQYQPERAGSSWAQTIRLQRGRIERAVKKTPSLKAVLADPDWWQDAWEDALVIAMREAGPREYPEVCPWSFDQIMTECWLPA